MIPLKELITDDMWHLRIILEVYALSLDIPLRVFQRDKASQFCEYAREIRPEFAERYPKPDNGNAENFDIEITELLKTAHEKRTLKGIVDFFDQSELKNLRSDLRDQRGEYWYTYQINMNHMLQSCSDYKVWRTWEFCWLYHQFVIQEIPKLDQTITVSWAEFDEPHLHLSYLWIEEIRSFIVLGPAWLPATKNTGEYFEIERSRKFVDNFISLIKEVDPGSDVSDHREALIQAGDGQLAISKGDMEFYLKQVVKSLRSLLKMTLPESFKQSLYRSDYIKLAEWSLFVEKAVSMMRHYYPKVNTEQNQCPACNTQFYYHLEDFKQSDPKCWIETNLNCERVDDLPQLHLRANLPKGAEKLEGTLFAADIMGSQSVQSLNDQEIRQLLKQLHISLSRFFNDIATKRDALKASYLSNLREWLNDRFGILAGIFEDKPLDKEKIEHQLSAQMLRFLQADITTIYRYHYDEEYLETIGIYSSETQKKPWQANVPADMAKAGKDKQRRHQSICYRAVDEHAVKFCRSFNPNTCESENGEPLLLPPTETKKGEQLHLESHLSGIAVPLSVYERPWGILEVLGTREHQFRWDDRRFVSELSHILTPFFYHQWFLKQLHLINEVAVTKKASGYNDICKHLAQMLLSYGSALWVLDEAHNGYLCKGWHKREDQAIKNEIIKLQENNRVISLTFDAMRKKDWKGYWQGTVGQAPLDETWLKIPTNQWMNEHKICSLCCIPVNLSQNTDTQEQPPVIAFIVLYNQIKLYDNRWSHWFKLVARYTAVIFEAMQEQDKWEHKNRQIIHHELHSKIKAIVDRTQNINGLVQGELSRLVDEKRKHDLVTWGKDIEIFADRLQNITTLLNDNKFHQYLGSMSPILSFAREYKNKHPLKWINLRKEFNDAFRTKWNLQNEKKLWIEYEAENEVEIQFHSQNLSYILDNLCDNAIKYAAIQTPIVARVEEASHSMKLIIHNIGRCLADGEEYRIFEDKYRGTNAQGELGEGFGLSIVRGICELYGIGIKYSVESYKHRIGLCKHQFTLSFPKRLARKKTYI